LAWLSLLYRTKVTEFMDQKGVLKLVAFLALLAVTGFSSLETFATTEQDVSDEDTNGLVSNGGNIVGTVQNISQLVNILSHNAREDGGYLHVVGEVENGLGRPIDFVQVTGTFYDANKQVIGTDLVFTDPNSLEAGETAPFDLTFFTDAVDSSEVASYKLRVSLQ
jgi:hypothetical protein